MNPTENVIRAYQEKQTITGIHRITGYNWQKIAKILSTEGIIVNEHQALILDLSEKGKTADEISKVTGFAYSTVIAYLPRRRPVYNENLSANAMRIKKCRENKKLKMK